MVAGKRRDLGLGGYPDVTLAQARERARETRAIIQQGRDPVAEREAAQAALRAAVRVPTFDECAKRFIAAKASGWRNPKHRAQWRTSLATYASPIIGSITVDRVELAHLVELLTPIWTEKTETAVRVRGRIESVLDWATVSGYRAGENPARWRGNLEHLLPAPSKVRRVRHHPAIAIDAMFGFMSGLKTREGVAARALEFLVLTAARSGEVRGATWSEIDLDAGVWTIPAERMKARREHRVPLSPQALEVLGKLPRLDPYLVFPSPRGAVLSDMALAAVMRRMGAHAVPHGFRSTFRDWAAERTAYTRDVAEMALAHTIGDKVEAAYRRGDLIAKRTRMMADWAAFIATPPATGKVADIAKARQKAA